MPNLSFITVRPFKKRSPKINSKKPIIIFIIKYGKSRLIPSSEGIIMQVKFLAGAFARYKHILSFPKNTLTDCMILGLERSDV